MATIDYSQAKKLLNESFSNAEANIVEGIHPGIVSNLVSHFDTIFTSNTQAYREVLLGCTLARILDGTIDIHLPYVSHGQNAFNARDLDEKIINPFLQSNRIPSTKGPYLSTFRRQVRFEPSTREGLRDKQGFDSLLSLIDYLSDTTEQSILQNFLNYLLYKFAELREASTVPLTRIQRFSLEQYEVIFSSLLARASGGLFPVLLVVCMFETIKEYFELAWEIDWQGINVADAASGAGGDISVFIQGRILISIEVTERQVDQARLVSTFNTKIAPSGIEDYLFLVGASEPTDEAKSLANRYFAQGHEINFAQIIDWLLMLLATLGKRGREIFNNRFMNLLEDEEVPKAVKVAWNDSVSSLFDQ